MTGFPKFFLFYIVAICTSTTLPGCTSGKQNYPAPPEYDLNHPVKITMPAELNEISGIFYYPKDTSIFAESDASGALYKIFPDKKTVVQKWKFGKNDDYEDLQLVDSTFYILSSKGNIVSLRFFSADSIDVKTFEFPVKGKNEFESLYYDKTTGLLMILCKDCEADKKGSLSEWSFNPVTQVYNPGLFTMDVTRIEEQVGKKKIRFKPSAAALNPLTNELFIICSIEKVLVVADNNGVVKNIYPLDPGIYKQPEGMAFTPSGDLLISNEFANEGSANILLIKNKRKLP